MIDALKFVAAATGILALFVVAPALLILWLHDKFWERRRKTWRQRLLTPKPEEVEQLCGGLLPERLISMYDDKDLISKYGLAIYPPSENRAEAPIISIDNFIPLRYERETVINTFQCLTYFTITQLEVYRLHQGHVYPGHVRRHLTIVKPRGPVHRQVREAALLLVGRTRSLRLARSEHHYEGPGCLYGRGREPRSQLR